MSGPSPRAVELARRAHRSSSRVRSEEAQIMAIADFVDLAERQAGEELLRSIGEIIERPLSRDAT